MSSPSFLADEKSKTEPPFRDALGRLTGGNPGNSGGKKGRSGRPRTSFSLRAFRQLIQEARERHKLEGNRE
jgi:hypothetical protein